MEGVARGTRREDLGGRNCDMDLSVALRLSHSLIHTNIAVFVANRPRVFVIYLSPFIENIRSIKINWKMNLFKNLLESLFVADFTIAEQEKIIFTQMPQ